MLTVEDARERLLSLAKVLHSETIPTEDAIGRTLSEPAIAGRSQPPADLSAMDGYAAKGPGPWHIVGESKGGAPYSAALPANAAIEISTGAVVPAGCEGIVIKESARVERDGLHSSVSPDPAFIRRRGFDFRQGDTVLGTGSVIAAPQLALLRMAGLAQVTIARRPRVSIIECGDELVSDLALVEGGLIPATNGTMVAAMCRNVAAETRSIGPLPDRLVDLEQAFETERAQDLVITIGGASVGRHDLIQPALEALGAEVTFSKVAMRPGKPLLVAKRGRQTIIGLPGNPASAFVTAFLFVLPFLRALQGRCTTDPVSLPLPLAGILPEGGVREEYRRARLVNGRAEPIDERDSSAVRALASADLLVRRPPHAPAVENGAAVDCYLLVSQPLC